MEACFEHDDQVRRRQAVIKFKRDQYYKKKRIEYDEKDIDVSRYIDPIPDWTPPVKPKKPILSRILISIKSILP